MIKPLQYKNQLNVSYVTIEMIKGSHTKKEVRNFRKWHKNQPCIICKDNTLGFYASNYEDWIKSGMPTIQSND